jgi:cobyrinic acid a,c-diamide synthase
MPNGSADSTAQARTRRDIPRLVIGGTASGVGKTTLMVGLTTALRRRGLRVAVFKCGPDYLDPSYHARASGGPCHNLDGWLMGRDAVLQTFERATREADIALVEGVMGLFDGASPRGDVGSTAEIAKWLEAPVVLCVDASGMARSIAAVTLGFKSFDPALKLAGIVANHVGSRSHLSLLDKALDQLLCGGLPKQHAQAFPERHLGLLSARDPSVTATQLGAWGDLVEDWCDLDRLVAIARTAPPLAAPTPTPFGRPETAPLCRIGIAEDQAFDFYYEDNLARLREEGAELVPFSPIVDTTLPRVDGLYFGGGYPEAHAAALAANASMRAAVRAFADAGGPVYAECGGLIYLSKTLTQISGERHDMVGLIDAHVAMREKLQALGYVEVETQVPSILGGAGVRFRGHQFRYSELEVCDDTRPELVYSLRRRRDDKVMPEGYRQRNVIASYVHAHWASNPMVARNFVRSCHIHLLGR